MIEKCWIIEKNISKPLKYWSPFRKNRTRLAFWHALRKLFDGADKSCDGVAAAGVGKRWFRRFAADRGKVVGVTAADPSEESGVVRPEPGDKSGIINYHQQLKPTKTIFYAQCFYQISKFSQQKKKSCKALLATP